MLLAFFAIQHPVASCLRTVLGSHKTKQPDRSCSSVARREYLMYRSSLRSSMHTCSHQCKDSSTSESVYASSGSCSKIFKIACIEPMSCPLESKPRSCVPLGGFSHLETGPLDRAYHPKCKSRLGMLQDYFRKEPCRSINADEAAALYAPTSNMVACTIARTSCYNPKP